MSANAKEIFNKILPLSLMEKTELIGWIAKSIEGDSLKFHERDIRDEWDRSVSNWHEYFSVNSFLLWDFYFYIVCVHAVCCRISSRISDLQSRLYVIGILSGQGGCGWVG